MAIAIPSYGTLLQVSDDEAGTNYTTIAGIKDPGQLKHSANMVDVTEHNTGSPWREFAPTLLTNGALTLSINWVPTQPTHSFGGGIAALLGNRSKRVFRYVYNSSAGSDYHQFPGYVSDISVSAPVDNVYGAQVQITPTGAPTFVTT